ncbi:MAG TPA: low affinity iron permease family protein [Dokdonella sp.]|nr:low affinity iron permease family protein [Dokdonella sp.]
MKASSSARSSEPEDSAPELEARDNDGERFQSRSILPVRLRGRRSVFDRFAGRITQWVGSPWAFLLAMVAVVVWAASGPIYDFSETWQMVINTGTTIVTFLMVFIIQQSQNKDSLAIHIKLNELLAAHELASNRVVAVEDLDEAELEVLRRFYCELSRRAATNGGIKESHSLDEARELAVRKRDIRARRSGAAEAA